MPAVLSDADHSEVDVPVEALALPPSFFVSNFLPEESNEHTYPAIDTGLIRLTPLGMAIGAAFTNAATLIKLSRYAYAPCTEIVWLVFDKVER